MASSWMELCNFIVLVTVGYFWKAKVSLICYIYATFLAFNFFHSFNFNETVRGRIKCYWSRGNNILIVFPSFIFFWKNKTKLFWFVRSTLLCSPRHFRVFVILHSTTFHVEYNFWIENTYGSVRVRIITYLCLCQ